MFSYVFCLLLLLTNTCRSSGAAIARNIGIEKASGRYIAFLDSDDFWKEDKLSHQIKPKCLNTNTVYIENMKSFAWRNRCGIRFFVRLIKCSKNIDL